MLRGGEEIAGRGMPVLGGKAVEELASRAGRVPAWLAPVVVHDGDDVDHAPGLDRVMHQMGVVAEPEIDRRNGEVPGRGLGGHERAPRGLAGSAWRGAMAKALAQGRPQTIGGNERQTL